MITTLEIHCNNVGSVPNANLIKNTKKGLVATIAATIETGPLSRPLYKNKSPNIIKTPASKESPTPLRLIKEKFMP